jgi:nucleoside-diphosphate-sugar epimerase
LALVGCMRVLLIGGNGFIGSHLVRELQDSGHQVALFHRRADAGAAQDREQKLLRIQGDRNRISDYRDRIQEFSPDVVVDFILSSGEQALTLMNALRNIAPRVVAISSMDVYRAWGVMHETEPGPLESLPLTEDSPLRKVRTVYPPETLKMLQGTFTWLDERYDKIAVEQAIMNDQVISGTVLRLPMVYGPGDPLHRFFPLLKRCADGRSAILFADDFATWRCPRGYVANVAHAIALAAASDHAAGRIYNICDEPTLPELEWQEMIAKKMRWPGRFVVLPREQTPKHLLLPGNAKQHVVATSQRIRTELGYREAVGLDEAIERTIEWEQRNPPSTFNPQQFDYAAEDAALAEVA